MNPFNYRGEGRDRPYKLYPEDVGRAIKRLKSIFPIKHTWGGSLGEPPKRLKKYHIIKVSIPLYEDRQIFYMTLKGDCSFDELDLFIFGDFLYMFYYDTDTREYHLKTYIGNREYNHTITDTFPDLKEYAYRIVQKYQRGFPIMRSEVL